MVAPTAILCTQDLIIFFNLHKDFKAILWLQVRVSYVLCILVAKTKTCVGLINVQNLMMKVSALSSKIFAKVLKKYIYRKCERKG